MQSNNIQAAEARYKNQQEIQRRDELLNQIQKQFTTVGIGILDELEQQIGYLWGHGKNRNQLTDLELRWLEIWQDIRTAILDRVNYRSRKLQQNLERIWKIKYHYDLKVGKRGS